MKKASFLEMGKDVNTGGLGLYMLIYITVDSRINPESIKPSPGSSLAVIYTLLFYCFLLLALSQQATIKTRQLRS